MKKKVLLILLSLVLVVPTIVGAARPVPSDIKRVVDNGYLGQGGLYLNRNINRAELATVVVRLLDLESEARNFKGPMPFKDVKNFQNGWASPYIGLAYREAIIQGTSSTTFNPQGPVSYVDMLTIFIRVLGYEDGMDLKNYPNGYYTKAVEIGLANVYMDMNKKLTRGDVALTMEKLLDLPMKNSETTLMENLNKKAKPEKPEKPEKIQIRNLDFTTTITGLFKGRLIGRDDFSDYKVELLSIESDKKKPKVYGQTSLDKNGIFEIYGFDISWIARIKGYRYKIYDGKDNLIMEGNLN